MTGYLLQVNSTVHRDNEDAYELAFSQFMRAGGFARLIPNTGVSLVAALRGKPYGYGRPHGAFASQQESGVSSSSPHSEVGWYHWDRALEKTDHVREYVNIWKLGRKEDLDLSELMMAYADDLRYMSINAQIVRERQFLVRQVQWNNGSSQLKLKPTAQVFKVTRRFSSKDIGDYLFSIGALFPYLASKGWRLVLQCQNITGALNVVTEFWQQGAAPAGKAGHATPIETIRDADQESFGVFTSAVSSLPTMVMVEPFEPLNPRNPIDGDGLQLDEQSAWGAPEMGA